MRTVLKDQKSHLHPGKRPRTNDETRIESLEQEAEHVIEEARMVLPGIQALFGFQLVAVFNNRFGTELLPAEQRLHLAALILVALSILLIMSPAAYHRQAERGLVSRYFVDHSSRLLTWAMGPLVLAISIEIYVIAQLILRSAAVSFLIAAGLFALFVWKWFLFPHLRAKPSPRREGS